jgi:oligopeptide transport system permease protein
LRIFSYILSFFLIVTLTFILMKALPGDPFQDEQALPKEIHAQLRRHFGLDDPYLIQYKRYIVSILSWDFGPSLRYKDRSVNDIIREGFPYSFYLGFQALIIATSLGTVLGVLGALKPSSWQDNTLLIGATLSVSIPPFILATLLQFVLASKLSLFPVARFDSWEHSILPTLALAALPTAFIARLIRANLIEVLKQDYIKVAYAKGLAPTRILIVHGLRNAIIPVISYLGPLTANILVGSFVIEKIFAIPGLGSWFVNSVLTRDYTVICGLSVFYSLLLLAMTFLVDLLQARLDPRIRVKNCL